MKKQRKNSSKSIIIWLYLVISVIGVLVVSERFNALIASHDKELTIDIDNLIAEKMNRSIEYMQQSVDEMARVLSYQDLLELDELYGQLTDSISESDYISIGIIAQDGTVYGHPSEKEEMLKWDLIELADKTQQVSISEPYRSGLNGKIVFTMFSPIYQQGERLGCIFVTYPLSEIQEIANSSVLKDEAEIYLVNAYSDNQILCSGSDMSRIGNWSSTRLLKNQISEDTFDDYQIWEESMLRNGNEKTVQFILNDIEYTQVYENIEAMDGWYVVVRIPNSTLSDTVYEFQRVIILFISLLIVLSIVLLFIIRKWDEAEKAKFEYMSTHDALTDVYNRNAFDSIVQKYLDEEGKSENGALIFLDIDYFKKINDNYGHDIGDRALVVLAGLLKEQFEKDSIIARYGGDEFVVMVKNLSSHKNLEKRLEKLKRTMREAQVLDHQDPDFQFHYSAGIVSFPDQGEKFTELVKYADVALYEVKQKGRNGYGWYRESKAKK